MAEFTDFDKGLFVTREGNVKVLEDGDVIKQSIITILSTIPGERVRNPEFGSEVYEFLFEPMDQFSSGELKAIIQDSLERFEDRIIIRDVFVSPNFDNNQYDLSVVYINNITGRVERFDGAVRGLGGF